MGAGKGRNRRAQSVKVGVHTSPQVVVDLNAAEAELATSEIFPYLRNFASGKGERSPLKYLQDDIRNADGRLELSNKNAELLAVALDRVAAEYIQDPGSDEKYVAALRDLAKKFWSAPKVA